MQIVALGARFARDPQQQHFGGGFPMSKRGVITLAMLGVVAWPISRP